MTKRKALEGLEQGTTPYVLAHWNYRRKKGKKNPITNLVGIKNPKKSLEIAKKHLLTSLENKSFPQHIIYYNKWSGFENKAIRSLFEIMPLQKALQLKKGDIVYLDSEPNPNGKVYGYEKITIKKIEKVEGGHRVHHDYGFLTIENTNKYHKIREINNFVYLKDLINEHPLSTRPTTMHDSEKVA